MFHDYSSRIVFTGGKTVSSEIVPHPVQFELSLSTYRRAFHSHRSAAIATINFTPPLFPVPHLSHSIPSILSGIHINLTSPFDHYKSPSPPSPPNLIGTSGRSGLPLKRKGKCGGGGVSRESVGRVIQQPLDQWILTIPISTVVKHSNIIFFPLPPNNRKQGIAVPGRGGTLIAFPLTSP